MNEKTYHKTAQFQNISDNLSGAITKLGNFLLDFNK